MTGDEMVGWHHRLSGHEFEQTLEDSEGQRSLAYCSPGGHKESGLFLCFFSQIKNKMTQFTLFLREKIRYLP